MSRMVPLPSGELVPGYALATATVQAFYGSLLASPEGILAPHGIHHAYQGAPNSFGQYWGVEVHAPGGQPLAFVADALVPDGGRGLWVGQLKVREAVATCLLVAEDALSALCAWELLPSMDQRRTMPVSLGGAGASLSGQRSLTTMWSFILGWAEQAGEAPRLLDATRNRRRQDSRATESGTSRDLRVLAGAEDRYRRHEPRVGGQSWAQVLTDLRQVERSGLTRLGHVNPTPRPVLTPAQAAAEKIKRKKLLGTLDDDDARLGHGKDAMPGRGQGISTDQTTTIHLGRSPLR